MDWQNRERSKNIEDRRSASRAGRGMPSIIGIIVLLVGAYYGVDLRGIVGGVSSGVAQPQSVSIGVSEQEQALEHLSAVVLRETEKVWGGYFHRHNMQYQVPKLVLYRDATNTACGMGSANAGPFYCPADNKLYIDLSFYNTMQYQLGAKGDAAFAYVLAHEVGHHVQTLLGTIQKVNQMQQRVGKIEANSLSVKLELQADCYAGVWAYYAEKDGLFKKGDIEEAYQAAEAVGNDTLQHRAQGYTVPHTYTHGTSAQRRQWFDRGLQTGDIKQCNTFMSA